MTNKIKPSIVGIIIALVVIALGFCCYHFRESANSPERVMNLVEDSFDENNLNKFNRYVDIDSLLANSYDDFIDGMIDADKSMPEEAKNAMANFSDMMKVPLTASLKTAIETYVESGSFSGITEEDRKAAEDDPEKQLKLDENKYAAYEMLNRAGLDKMDFRKIDKVKIDKDDKDKATARVRVYQKEAEVEFVFEVELNKDKSGDWKVVKVNNFREFITMLSAVRRTQLDKYLDATAEIITRHDKIIREAESKYGTILSIGSLGRDDTRDDLKTLITDVVIKDWEERKQELFKVSTPKEAKTLQNIRLKICDLSIESAKEYAKWMSDKKAATIKEAEAKRKQVQTLQEEEKILVNRMTSKVQSSR